MGNHGLNNHLTELQRVEAALRECEEHYRRLAELSSDAIAIHSQGKIVDVNTSGAKLLGVSSPEELIGTPVLNLVHPDYREIVQARIRQTQEEEGPTPLLAMKLLRLSGEAIDVEVKSIGITYQGQPATQVIVRDIAERQQADAALRQSEEQLRRAQKVEVMGRLAGGVVHDFNNLLTAILGYSELLLRRLHQDDPLRRYVIEIQKAGEWAAALTRQLLAFSRKQMPQPKVLDLDQAVAEMNKLLRRLIGENIELVTMLNSAGGLIEADAGQIEQVILNLAVNARDAMPQGGKLIIETARISLDEDYASQHVGVRPGPYILLAVSDTGHGMDAETKARIFEPFFTTKEEGKGTGLGLSTVYGIVKQAGGNIWVYSEVGRGTTFKVYLPQIKAGVASSVPAPPTQVPQGTETILLVEDETIVRRLVREVLTMNGYTVLEAADGQEALGICEQHEGPIHLLITDIIMPQMSGRELAERLRLLHPEIKALYISGYTESAIVHHGVLDAGVPFLQKPFTPGALPVKVREVLSS